MNAKRFFYASAGILLLVIAYSVGARRAAADLNYPNQPIIGMDYASNAPDGGYHVLASDGGLWKLYTDSDHVPTWVRSNRQSPLPPVPISDFLFWSRDFVVTRQGEGWLNDGARWFSAGVLPVSPVANGQPLWSDVKRRYKG